MNDSRTRSGEVADSFCRFGNFFTHCLGRNATLVCILLLASLFHEAAAASPAYANATWKILARGGYVILLRHTVTVPGVGDPPGFVLNNCATQRNLSADGRAQAARWRSVVAENSVPIGAVFSSEWCRCVDTATIAFGSANATPKRWPALNSFFESAQNQSAQTVTVKKRLPLLLQEAKKLGNNAVFVTHQVNITALTGIAPQSGEAVVIQLDAQRNISVVGRVLVE